MSAILTVALPLFAIIALGAAAGRLRLMTAAQAQALNRFVFLFAMPVAVFGFTSSNEPPGAAMAALALGYVGAAASVIIGSFLFARIAFGLSVNAAGAHAFASSLGNAVFLGLPIALSVEGWGPPFLLLMVCEALFVIGVGTVLMTWPEQGERPHLAQTLAGVVAHLARNPIVMGAVLGFAFAYAGVPTPAPIRMFLSAFGHAAGPTALFALGLYLTTGPKADFRAVAGHVSAIGAAKLFILPALAITFVHAATGGDATLTAAVALFTAMPVAVTVFVQSEHYGVYVQEAAAAIAATTIVSLATISLVLLALA